VITTRPDGDVAISDGQHPGPNATRGSVGPTATPTLVGWLITLHQSLQLDRRLRSDRVVSRVIGQRRMAGTSIVSPTSVSV
jgi:hypothetical protein